MKKHVLYYISLATLLCIGFGLPVFFAGQKNIQLMILILTAFLYTVWGVSHHVIHHSFSIKIMLEYIAIAILGVSILLFVFKVAL